MNSVRTTISRIILFSTMAAGLTHARFVLAGIGAAQPTAAPQATADNTKAQIDAPTQQPANDAKTASPNPTADLPVLGPYFRQEIVNAKLLRRRIQENLPLSPSQNTNIDRLFDGFIEETVKKAHKRRNDLNERADKGIPAAKPSADASADLIVKLKAELNPDQVTVFEKVVDRWTTLKSPIPRTAPMHQLNSAIRDPDVGLSAEQQKTVDALLKEMRTSLLAGDKLRPPSAEERAEAAEKLRIAIYAMLTPDQRTKMDANYKLFKEEAEELAHLANRGIGQKETAKDDQ